MEKICISQGKIARILVALGALLCLAACTDSVPYIPIPITGLTAITPTATWQRVILGILGGVLLVAGFSLVKVFIQIVGFLGGGMLGIYLAQMFFPSAGSIVLISFIIGGLIGLGFTLNATNLGVFAAGALAGVAVAQQLWPYFENPVAPWLGLLGAVLLGVALGLTPIYWIIFFAAGILIQTLFSRTGKISEKQESG